MASKSREFKSEVGKLNLLPTLSIGVLQEIGRRCNSKVYVVSACNCLFKGFQVLFFTCFFF